MLSRMENSDNHIQPKQSLDLVPFDNDSDTELPSQSASFHNSGASSINTQPAHSHWISQFFPTDPIEALHFPAPSGDHDTNGIQFPENTLTGTNPHHDSDNKSQISKSRHSPSSLYQLPDSAMTCDSYDMSWSSTNVTPALETAERSSFIQDPLQSASDGTVWRMHTTKRSGAARPLPADEVSSSMMKLPEAGKTVLTLENLDSETRLELVDLLCKRKIVTRIEIV